MRSDVQEFRAQITQGDDVDIQMLNDPGFKRAEEACDTRFTLLWDGQVTSLRASTLSLCRSVIITHDSPWETWSTAVLNAYAGWGGIQSVGRNWTTLRSIMAEANANPSVVDYAVANKAALMQRLQSPTGIACYWVTLMHEITGLLRYNINLSPGLGGDNLVPVEQWLLEHLKVE
jgi:hypothetical protein